MHFVVSTIVLRMELTPKTILLADLIGETQDLFFFLSALAFFDSQKMILSAHGLNSILSVSTHTSGTCPRSLLVMFAKTREGEMAGFVLLGMTLPRGGVCLSPSLWPGPPNVTSNITSNIT